MSGSMWLKPQDEIAEQAMRAVSWARPQARIACPACQPGRRHTRDRTLSVTLKDDGSAAYYCHHCGAKGAMHPENVRSHVTVPPVKFQLRTGGEAVAPQHGQHDARQWLAGRGIGAEVAGKAGVVGAQKWVSEAGGLTACVGFPYVVNGDLVGVKYRALTIKGFTMEGSAGHFFGLNLIPKDAATLVITEGEVDALSFMEAGLPAVSVPSGAMSPGQSAGSKLACIANALDHLKPLKKIIIATDNDAPGKALGEEIARRLGRSRCWKVAWPDDRKDANDVLKADGRERLRAYADQAQPWPISGLFGVEHYLDVVRSEWLKGSNAGHKIGLPSVDDLLSFVPGELSVVTGIPGSGKSEFVDQIMISLAERHGWRFAVCSFENPPAFHIPKLIEKHLGKPFRPGPAGVAAPGPGGSDRVQAEGVSRACSWLKDRFLFIENADGEPASLDSILDRASAAVGRLGANGLVIDPYNYLNLGSDESETNAISNMLSRVREFAKAHSVHVFFVAHPTKLYREGGHVPVPKGYDISSSAHWFNKADLGFTVHRAATGVEVHVWKVRFKHIGKTGVAYLAYDPVTGIYSERAALHLRDPF